MNRLITLCSILLFSWVPLSAPLSAPLMAQAPNDECSGAVSISPGINNLDSTLATTGTDPIPVDTCPGTALGQVAFDVWYSLEVPESGLMTISTCDTVNFDTDVIVYTGSCDNLIPLACHGDSASCLVQGTTNSWNTILSDVSVVVGETLWIRIGGWGDQDLGSGTFELEIVPPPPPPPPPPLVENDECLDASPAFVGLNPLVTSGATTSQDPYSDITGCTALGQMYSDVWFRWTAPAAGNLSLKTCDSVDFDTDLVVYSGECDALTQRACSGDESDCLLQGSATLSYNSRIEGLPVNEGEILYLRLGGWGDGQSGSGELLLEFAPAAISSVSGVSHPGSWEIEVTTELVADCSGLLYSVNGSETLVTGPFFAGDLIIDTFPTLPQPSMMDFCVAPIFGTTPGVSECSQVAVLGPILAESCASSLGFIPDAGEPLEIPLVINGDPAANVLDLILSLETNHPDASQLLVQLIAPNGTTETLHNQPFNATGSGLNLTWWMSAPLPGQIFDDGGFWQPSYGNLYSFTGPLQEGTWTLRISDEVPGLQGEVLLTCLKFFDTSAVLLTGQDLIIGDANNIVQVDRDGSIASFGMESVICNGGSDPLHWYANPDPRHPMMIFNMFRVDSDRIIQIGGSWAKHGWSSAQADACGFGCQPSPTNQETGIGCSDTYGASGNAAQINMGPRSEIDPWTGSFSWSGSFMSQDTGPWNPTEERLSIEDVDLDPSQNPASQFVAEVYVIQPADEDPFSNHAWEPVTVSGSPGGTWEIDMSAVATNSPVQEAWPNSEIVTVSPSGTGDGHLFLASKVTELSNGTWQYEYALYNLNFGAGIGGFEISVDPGVEITSPRFHAPFTDSPFYSSTPWEFIRSGTTLRWQTLPESFGSSANPLRWGWLYNFGFVANQAPTSSTVTLESHLSSPYPTLEATVQAPPPPPAAPQFKRGLCNPDSQLDLSDVLFLLDYQFSGGLKPVCLDSCDGNDDGAIDLGDAIYLLGYLFMGQTPPAAPGPLNCGVDPTPDTLECSVANPDCP